MQTIDMALHVMEYSMHFIDWKLTSQHSNHAPNGKFESLIQCEKYPNIQRMETSTEVLSRIKVNCIGMNMDKCVCRGMWR